MLSSGFYPKITLPIRICNSSSTIIDNIFSNGICSNDASDIFINHISDNQTSTKLKMIWNNNMFREKQRMMFHCRSDKHEYFRNIKWKHKCKRHKNYEVFSKLVQEAKNKHLPIKRIKFYKYKHKKCRWIANGILKSIKTKDIIYKMLKQSNPANVEAFEILKAKFNRFHNILRQSIKGAKQIYYLRSFQKFKHDIKQI